MMGGAWGATLPCTRAAPLCPPPPPPPHRPTAAAPLPRHPHTALQVYKDFKEGAKRILVATDLVSGAGCCVLGAGLGAGSWPEMPGGRVSLWFSASILNLAVLMPPPPAALCRPHTAQVGRGIDIERVNIVINYDMPETGGC